MAIELRIERPFSWRRRGGFRAVVSEAGQPQPQAALRKQARGLWP